MKRAPIRPSPILVSIGKKTGEPAKQPHEYAKNGTAKLLTLFHPATRKVHVKGVTTCPNTVLHSWLQQELTQILALLPPTRTQPRGHPCEVGNDGRRASRSRRGSVRICLHCVCYWCWTT